MPSPSPVVVLDIGASKVHCLVGEAGPDGDCKILGMGISPCRGIRRSAIIDMPRVVESIRNAVAEAERAAGPEPTDPDAAARPEIETDVHAALRLTESPYTAGKSSRRTRRPRKTSKPLPLL